VVDPRDVFGDALVRGLPHPLDLPGYANNALLPGSAPIELSFSEVVPAALRFDLEPLGWGSTHSEIMDDAMSTVRELVARHWGDGAAAAFAARARTHRTEGDAPSGAFIGAAFDATGLAEVKVYLRATSAAGLTEGLVATATEQLAGLEPLMHAVAVTAGTVAERAYLVSRRQVDLLELEPLLARLGLAHRAPELIITLQFLCGGAHALGPGSVVIGLRHIACGAEVKVDLPAVGLSGCPLAAVDALLAERPATQSAFGRWLAAVEPPGSTVEASVVSARVSAEQSVRLNAYLHPVGEPAGDGGGRYAMAGTA